MGIVCMCHSSKSCGARAGLVIAGYYPPGKSLQLIIAQSMGKAVTFHAPRTSSSYTRGTVSA